MSYTNGWSDTIPAGSELASHIDDAIRQVRLDIHERMDDIVVDWTSDPVVLQTVAGGDVSRYIPPTAFWNPSLGLATPQNFVVAESTNGPVVAPLSSYLPFNATITRIKYWLDLSNTSQVQANIRSIPFGAGSYVNTDVAASIISTSSGAIQVMDTGVISIPLDSTKFYDMIYFAPGGAAVSGHFFAIYGAFVTFTI